MSDQFSAEELSLIVHLAEATLTLYTGLRNQPGLAAGSCEQIEQLRQKCLQLAFMGISHDA
jgi:hypothetical protein